MGDKKNSSVTSLLCHPALPAPRRVDKSMPGIDTVDETHTRARVMIHAACSGVPTALSTACCGLLVLHAAAAVVLDTHRQYRARRSIYRCTKYFVFIYIVHNRDLSFREFGYIRQQSNQTAENRYRGSVSGNNMRLLRVTRTDSTRNKCV